MYVGINMQAIAVDQHGPGAEAVCSGAHAYNWHAKTMDGQKKGLDLQAYAHRRS